jgi:hypothetical protein
MMRIEKVIGRNMSPPYNHYSYLHVTIHHHTPPYTTIHYHTLPYTTIHYTTQQQYEQSLIRRIRSVLNGSFLNGSFLGGREGGAAPAGGGWRAVPSRPR